jgi:uncharacterized protein (DUF302 family)
MRLTVSALVAAGLIATPALGQEAITYSTDSPVDDVIFAVESEILAKGLVIDHVSHVGEMLARTKEDVGGTMDLYTTADVFAFCSATVSRAAMEADPANIRYCPYTIFVYERADNPGTTVVGFQDYPDGAMQQVEDMLDEIVTAAIGM